MQGLKGRIFDVVDSGRKKLGNSKRSAHQTINDRHSKSHIASPAVQPAVAGSRCRRCKDAGLQRESLATGATGNWWTKRKPIEHEPKPRLCISEEDIYT